VRSGGSGGGSGGGGAALFFNAAQMAGAVAAGAAGALGGCGAPAVATPVPCEAALGQVTPRTRMMGQIAAAACKAAACLRNKSCLEATAGAWPPNNDVLQALAPAPRTPCRRF
jgi:hypothetical protein